MRNRAKDKEVFKDYNNNQLILLPHSLDKLVVAHQVMILECCL